MLLKSCMLKSAKLILGNASAAKLGQISLSSNTIQRRIADVSKDVKEQVVNEIKASAMFSFQVDESTDVSSCAQFVFSGTFSQVTSKKSSCFVVSWTLQQLVQML